MFWFFLFKSQFPWTLSVCSIISLTHPAINPRGEIQCIGATTLDEYRQYIEKDGALERRFQKIIVEPTTVEQTLEILRNIKDQYESHHNVNFTSYNNVVDAWNWR